MSLLQNSNAIPQLGGYNLTDSLRFRESASAYLSRTPATASNRQTWTWSAWVKRGNVAASSYYCLFGVDGVTPNNRTEITFSSNAIFIYEEVTSATISLTTTGLFRDPSAWYHIVVAIDTTQATSTNRVKLYVNGEQITSFSSATYPSLNYNTFVNSTNTHVIGARRYASGTVNKYFDGYLTEVNFVDGQALTPSDFGEYNEDTGVWQPKKYTGTYGTNGFYLKGRGTDNSGNGNNWTENNFNTSNSALTTYDIMTDVPTLTDEDTANFCTLNPLIPVSTTTAINGNLGMSGYNPAGSMFGTVGVSSGKWYFEMVAYADAMSGISGTSNGGAFPGAASNAYTWDSNNATKISNSTGASYGSATSNGDIVGVAFDLDSGSIVFYKNGVSQGTAYTFTPSGIYFPAFRNGSSTNTSVNFGQRPFAYTPPTGYLKLNTFNLPDSSIVDGSQYMNTLTWTGDGTSSRSITGLGFQPDLVWWKNRTTARWHQLFDSVRGADKALSSNAADVEDAAGGYGGEGSVTSFDSDGFTLQGGVGNNESSSGIVGWSWRGSDSSAVSNTNGTIGTSQVSANPTAGFSIVTYTGDGSNANRTVGHGLGVAPEMVIVKTRSEAGRHWIIWHKDLTNYDYGLLFNTGAAAANRFGPDAPTSSVFGVYGGQNNRGTETFVAYCFAGVEGYSKFGSYTGNGSTDGPFVYTGFRPAFVLGRDATASGQEWYMYDTSRNTYNVANSKLSPDLSNAETNLISPEGVDFLSNGFKLRVNDQRENQSGSTFIYMAFAENPMKHSLAR